MNKNNNRKSISKYWKVVTAFALMTSIGASYHPSTSEASSGEATVKVAQSSSTLETTKSFLNKKEDNKDNPYGIIVDFPGDKDGKEPAKPVKEADNKYVKKVKGLFTSSKYTLRNATNGFDVSYKDKKEQGYRLSGKANKYTISGSYSKRTFDVSAKSIKALGCFLSEKEIRAGLDKAKSKGKYYHSGVEFSYKDSLKVEWRTKEADNKHVKKVRSIYNSPNYELRNANVGFMVLYKGEPDHGFGAGDGDGETFFIIKDFFNERSLSKASKAIKALGCKLTEKQIRTGFKKAFDTQMYTKNGVDFFITNNQLVVMWYY